MSSPASSRTRPRERFVNISRSNASGLRHRGRTASSLTRRARGGCRLVTVAGMRTRSRGNEEEVQILR